MLSDISCALMFGCVVLSSCSLQGAGTSEATVGDGRIDRETLSGKRFQFSWSSADGGGVNGVATLREDGSIQGIGSPNETTWLLGEDGRLLFKHADGRVSTRYEKCWREDGLLRFEGPFLFREGIVHHLLELEGVAFDEENRIAPEQAEKIKYSTQRFAYLDVGETCAFRLKDGTEKRIRLVAVEEYKDPVIDLVRGADVRVEIDGSPLKLTCAPYVMPTETGGLRIQADTTSAWLEMPARVQFSLWDASDPIVDTELFRFPLPAYHLFSHGIQAYNEPVHLGHRDGDPAGQRFYHNYGVDLAGYEARQKVLSAIDGIVVQADRGEGSLSVRDDRGFILNYGHLDSILSEVEVGSRVARGQWVGMLGRRGASGNFSHLHVGAFLSESALAAGRYSRNLNLYPWLVTAYRGTGPHAVARPHRIALTGDAVRFDGSNSVAFGSRIAGFRWEFHDGASANGPEAEKVYDAPGCYMACLWLEGVDGKRDVDFCKVKVFSRSAQEEVIPTLFVTYIPSAEVRVGQPVCFRVWPQGMAVRGMRIDFGDGAVVEDHRAYGAILHAFKEAGIHVVTVTGTAAGLPVTQKVKVVVEE